MKTRLAPWTVAALAIALCTSVVAQDKRFKLDVPADWQAADQPDLKQQIDAAPPLRIENLGSPVKGLDYIETNLVPNGRGGWDFLVWYRQAYRRQTRVYMVDLKTGDIKKQTFEKEEGKIRMENGFTWYGVFAPDGKLYGPNVDWSKGGGSVINLYQYDPAAREVKLVRIIENIGNERAPLALSPNGRLYGAGSYMGPDRAQRGKAAAYGYNPITGEFKDFGPIGEKCGNGYGYLIGCCDTHVYVACGANPWYLAAIEIATGKQTILAKAPDGSFQNRMYLNSGRYNMPGYFGGAMVYLQQNDDNSTRKFYWLYHGQLIPKKLQSFEMDESVPWPTNLQSPQLKAGGAPPEVFDGQLYPDENDRATVWWRAKTGDGEWKAINIDGVQKHPENVHRLVSLPGGRIFGVSSGHAGRFMIDAATGKATQVGSQGGESIYPMIYHDAMVYWSGYPSAPIYCYDPAKPWTMKPAGPPGGLQPLDPADEKSNPRLVHKEHDAVYKKTRVKKMLCATVANGVIYFGGKGQRDYEGGGMSWYDPKTGEVGGLWKSFENRDIGWITPACDERYIVMGTEGGKVSIFDTTEKKVISDFEPVGKAWKAGVFLEVAPGRILGETHDDKNKGAGIMYAAEIPSGKILFKKALPYAIPFDWSQGLDKYDYTFGPDGYIWTWLDVKKHKALVRIDPRDARVEVIGKTDIAGQIVFVGKDIYLSGANELRRIINVVPKGK